jgi:hypothetical protein
VSKPVSIFVSFVISLVGVFAVDTPANATTIKAAPPCKNGPENHGGYPIVGTLQCTPDKAMAGKYDWVFGIPPGTAFTCVTNVVEFSAGNDHRTEQFRGVYLVPDGLQITPGTASGEYWGREGFGVGPNNVFPHSMLCSWWARGGPVGGPGGYVHGFCKVRATACTPQ